jgi:hypothetical protein
MLLNVIKEKDLADYNFVPFTRAAKDGPPTGWGAGGEVRPSSTAAASIVRVRTTAGIRLAT